MEKIDKLAGKLMALDNFNAPEVRIKDYIQPQPIFMSRHLDIICTQGSYSFIQNGVEHVCGPGSLTVIVKDTFCRFTSATDDCRLGILTSDTNRLHLEATALSNLILFQHRIRRSPVFNLSEDEMKNVLDIYYIIKRFASDDTHQFRAEICQSQHVSLFYLLFGKMEIIDSKTSGHRGPNNNICRSFMANVEKHFREQRKLEFYANLQCVSTKHLSFAVKKESGISAHQIIADYVMIEAKALLSNHDLSIADIADALHFPNQSFFGKFFKAHEGMSPLQYRTNSM